MLLSSTVRLVDPKTGTELVSYGSWTAGGVLKSIDLGFPAVRESKSNRSGAHGTVDSTRFFGDRAITAEVWMPQPPNTDSAVDQLAGFMNPASRLWLYVQRPNWPQERRTLVRGAAFACPPGVMRVAQAGWVSSSGLFEDAAVQSVTLVPSGTATGGRSYPLVEPRSYVSGLVTGATLIALSGNAPSPPTIDIYGPCSDPMVRCVDTGEQIAFTGLSLAAGDFLRVDMAARTVFLNNDPSQSRYNRLDFAHSTWWQLPAGDPSVQVVFSPFSPSPGCQAVLSWRNQWI